MAAVTTRSFFPRTCSGTPAFAAPLVAERAVVIPCLHDEAYARLEVLRPVIGDPALVWFLSEPEHQLAHGLGPVARRHSVTGAGVPVPLGYDPLGFAEKHNLRRPFVLFAGRNEEGKGHAWLLEAFAAAVTDRGLDLDLVTIGKGDPGAHRGAPKSVADRVIDLGFVSDEERNNAFAAASAYVQPSRVESFSRTVMESWLAGTPVIASTKSNVVAWHCWRSGGGLMFSTDAEFAEHLDLVARKPEQADEVAAAGRRYVIDNYTWPNVLDRMEASLAAAL